jgi:hypothetical protein
VTATPVPDDELTEDEDDWRPVELDEVELAVVELLVVELVVVEAFVAAACVVDDIPGMVWALTVASTPTAATAANATPAVSWLSRRVAVSRA